MGGMMPCRGLPRPTAELISKLLRHQHAFCFFLPTFHRYICSQTMGNGEGWTKTQENPVYRPNIYKKCGLYTPVDPRQGNKPISNSFLNVKDSIPKTRQIQDEIIEHSRERRYLPGETFFNEVNMRSVLSLAADAAHIVAETAVSADQHTHSSDLILDLHADQSIHVGTTREHLDGGTGALNLLGVSRAGDEQHDTQDFPPTLHGENAGHPGTDPFEVLRRLNDPHQCDAAGRDSAVCVPLN